MTKVVYIADYRPTGDGKADDYGHMSSALAACGKDGLVVLEGGGKKYYMGASLEVPKGVRIINPGNAGGNGIYDQEWFESMGGIVIDPGSPIRLQSRSGLEGLVIAPAGMEFPQADADKWTGTAVVVDTHVNEPDIKIENSLIMGFAVGLDARLCPRIELNKLMIDCANGLTINGAGDTIRLDAVHVWPFATASGPKSLDLDPGPGLNRDGTAFEFLNNTDGGTVSRCFSGHHEIGFRAANLNGLRFDHCGAEALFRQSATGYRFEGAVQNVELTACQGVGCQNGVVVDLEDVDHFVSINGGMYATNTDNNIRVFMGTVAVRNANLGFKADKPDKDGNERLITAAHIAIIGRQSNVILQNSCYKSGIPLVEFLIGSDVRQILDCSGNVAVNPHPQRDPTTRQTGLRRLLGSLGGRWR